MVDGCESLCHCLDAVAAKVLHQRSQFVIRSPFDQCRHFALITKIVQQALPPNCASHECQCRIVLVRTGIDPISQPFATGFRKRLALCRTVLDADNIPTERVEDLLDPLEQAFAHDSVQRLPVVVDDPPDVAQVVLPALLKGFVDIAFVEFCVTDQCDHAPHQAFRAPLLGTDVILNNRCKCSEGHAQPDRPGREIHVVHILGPAWITLDPREAAEVFHLFAGDVAHQVLHRVKDRTGMRLDRDAVLRLEGTEV